MELAIVCLFVVVAAGWGLVSQLRWMSLQRVMLKLAADMNMASINWRRKRKTQTAGEIDVYRVKIHDIVTASRKRLF